MNNLGWVAYTERYRKEIDYYKQIFHGHGLAYTEGYLSSFGLFSRIWAEFWLVSRYLAAREVVAELRSPS